MNKKLIELTKWREKTSDRSKKKKLPQGKAFFIEEINLKVKKVLMHRYLLEILI